VCVGLVTLAAAGLAAGAPAQPPKLPDGVTSRPVVIWSEGTRMVGDVYFPKGHKEGDRLPAVICCNGWGGTRQNTTGRVAASFARHGYVALAFDYRGWGDSDSKLVLREKMPPPDGKGEVTVKVQAVREVVDPVDEALDIRHALDFMAGEPGVDRERLGLWGTSYGGGLVTWTAAHDRRVKCVVAQVAGMGQLSAKAVRAGEELARQQARGTIGPVPQDYGQVPGLRGRANLAKMVGYNAVEAAARVRVPTLFIDAEKEELFDRLQNGKKAHDLLTANGVPTKYHVVKGITHYGIYREAFAEADRLAREWFDEHLKGRGAR
jgi:dienelactone hydrolase